MNEKSTLLPSAPSDVRFFMDGNQMQQPQQLQQHHDFNPTPVRIVLVQGLEYDPSRKYKYGSHALLAAGLVFASFLLIEFRNCDWTIGTDLNKLQALHTGLLLFSITLYLLSLFGFADFLFQYKLLFALGLVIVCTFAGLMVYTTYEAVVNPCAHSNNIPVDFHFGASHDVFGHKDGIGIMVVMLDIVATLLLMSATVNFYRRY